MKNKIKFKKGTIAISQILILIIAIFAISWIIGGDIKVVSATDTGNVTTKACTLTFCSGNNVYGSKRDDTGTCVINLNNLKEQCNYGCSAGICELKSASFGSNLGKAATTTSSIVTAIPATEKAVAIAKGVISGGAAAETAATASTLEGAIAGGSATGGVHGMYSVSTLASIGWEVGIIAAWSAVAFVLGRYVFGAWLGLNTQQSQALGYALAAGTAAGMIAANIIGASSAGGPIGIVIGAVVAIATFVILAKKSSLDIIQYGCSQWDAQSGKGLTEAQRTQRCRMCNSQEDLICTEYQCRSLGQGCMLINDADSGKQLCIWNNTKDINPPIIIPWEKALLDDFAYTPDNAISPPDKGVKITYTGNEDVTSIGTMKCAPAFTQISFGVQLDEAAKCKISPLKVENYSVMADIFMGRGIRDYNQSFTLSLPSNDALEAENLTLENGGQYELYVRCEDSNGNSNIANFVFKFCITEGPDTTAPLILGTSIYDNQPIAYGQKSINLELYVNEPSECRWSKLDKDYDAMENNMTCDTSVTEMNTQMSYTCKGNLTGLKDNEDNKFYFRCKDQPILKGTEREDERNANTESYPLTLIGTQPLVIEEVGPTGIIEDSTDTIKVNLTAQTAAGYDEGKAVCSFSETGKTGSYIDFFYGYDVEPFSQYQHSQELWLEEGDYTYFIRCVDLGGNADYATTNFSVRTDTSSPIVVRVYKEDDYLKLITDEPGRCVYSNFGCTYLFADGTEMYSLDEKEYYAEWDINQDFYIKCEDEYGNQPASDECSIIARPFEIFQLQ
jgi:hypothetical protein